MIKRFLLVIAMCCIIVMPSVTRAAGFTLWSVTDQIVEVDNSKLVAGRIGYDFSIENEGLEIFVGSSWNLRYDKPQTMSLGIINHLPDLIDPNNPLPFIPGFLLTFVNQDIEVCPYLGLEGSFNFIDRDSGFYALLIGALAKVTPKSQIEYGLEGAYTQGFNELEGTDEYQLRLLARIRF